jgi:hypothetical protein
MYDILFMCIHDDMDELLENSQELLMILKGIYTYIDLFIYNFCIYV